MNKLIAALVCLSVAGCTNSRDDFDSVVPAEAPEHFFDKKLDTALPFTLLFGQGSGMNGLESTVVSPDGEVRLTRLSAMDGKIKSSGRCENPFAQSSSPALTDAEFAKLNALQRVHDAKWESMVKVYGYSIGYDWAGESRVRQTTTRLSPRAMNRIAEAIVAYGLLESPSMSDANVHDGDQWVFCVAQNGMIKSLYFSNYFPLSIRRFATVLEEELAAAPPTSWVQISEEDFKAGEKQVWDSIR